MTEDISVARERALVLRELAHRIKNLFAVVDGVILLSARLEPQAKLFAASLRARIAGMARAVSYIYDGGANDPAGAAHSVHGLLGELLNPFGERGATANGLRMVGDDQALSEASITPLALIFNELATNALKYGSLAQPGGLVTVSTARRGDLYEIRWAETGARNVSEPLTQGFGTTLLDRTVTQQLGAAIRRDWRSDGLEVEIVVPLKRLAA